ncbi:MAG: hypothetical protein SNJ55_13850 [Chloroherpetonaceae bacterium]
MPSSLRQKSTKYLLNHEYLYQRLSEPPFQGVNHLQQAHEILRKAASRYLQSIQKESRTTLQDIKLDELQSEEDRPLSLRTLKNHLTELQEGKKIGSFQEHTYLCLTYAAKQLKAEGLWEIDIEKLKVPDAATEQAKPLAQNENSDPAAPSVAFQLPALSSEFYFSVPKVSATMPATPYPPSVYERSNSVVRFGIGAFFSLLASLSIILFYIFGASVATLVGAFITLSIMNSISPRQSFTFAVYSESILVIVFFVLLALHK